MGAAPARADLVPPLPGATGRMPPLVDAARKRRAPKPPTNIPYSLDTAVRVVSPGAQIAEGLTAGYSFQGLGTIGFSAALNYGVDAECSGVFASYGAGQAQVDHAWQDYTVKINSPAINSSTTRRGEILKVKIVSGKVKLPWGGQLAIGGSRYSESGYSFTQPFIATSIVRGKAKASAGINWTSGNAPSYGAAPFASAQAPVFRSAVAFVDYSARDFSKIIVNNYLLPATGIDCSGCSKDALNFGVAARIGKVASASIGMYDARDLATPFGNLSLNWDF